ncbi:hypothetical protein ACSX1A_19440 [Pontibacter sp. MBLB2868]|uniref:hypothetical protein n=1 Tax=Pontibacter sp. MBLB2868 TaxID=3451555 RepID=UPI003F752799
MDLLFLTFGPNIKNHYQANFCMLSFLVQQEEVDSINVYTDQPSFYERLSHKINIIHVTEAMLKSWKGEHDFFWRIKIKALEHFILSSNSNSLIYLDSDTFLYNDIKGLKAALQESALMHEEEGKLSQLKSKTEKLMWEQVRDKSFGGVTITESHTMWNAGVVAIPQKNNLQAVQLALSICDDMCRENVTRRLIEQFALSVALAETYGLQAADKWIGHYWSNKEEWNVGITQFFLGSYLKGGSIEQDIARMKEFGFSGIPIRKREKNTKLRLASLLDRIFPAKEVAYIK